MAQLIPSVFGHTLVKSTLLRMTKEKFFFSGAIFSGPEGVGKKKMALALLQELNCEKPTACGACERCLKVANGGDQFLFSVEPENGKIKIEQVREIIQFTSLQSWIPHRFVLLNALEKITPQAANALLKSLEEPPEGVHFVFITANLAQVMPTLRSRCQVVTFSPLSDQELLKIVPQLEPWQLRWSFGRASLASKIVQEEWMEVRKSSINFLHSSQNTQIYEKLLGLIAEPQKMEFVMHSWLTYLRDAYWLSQGEVENIYNVDIQAYAQKFSQRENWSVLFDKISSLQKDYYGNVDKNLLLENLSMSLGSI